MGKDFGAQISTRALQHLGVPFRLHGRDAVGGFDCVGLVGDVLLHAGFDAQASADYSLRGRFSERVFEFFNHPVFTPVQTLRVGDFLAVRTAPRQIHLMIAVSGGFVHAHASLRRVVLTPAPLPWPVIGHWRFIGD